MIIELVTKAVAEDFLLILLSSYFLAVDIPGKKCKGAS